MEKEELEERLKKLREKRSQLKVETQEVLNQQAQLDQSAPYYLDNRQQRMNVEQRPVPTQLACTTCPQCESLVPLNSRFCPSCGKDLTEGDAGGG